MASSDAKIIPRWEWRTFGLDTDGIFARVPDLSTAPDRESSELYLLYKNGPQNAKIRNDLLDVKRLLRVDSEGLQQWTPVIKEPFPLSRRALNLLFDEWRLKAPNFLRESYSLKQFLNEIITKEASLRPLEVAKRRRGVVVQDCIVEIADLSFEGQHLETFSVEQDSQEKIIRLLRALGLRSSENVSYPDGLKRAIGF